MNLSQLLQKYQGSESVILLSHILGKTKEFLYLHPNFILTKKQIRTFTKYITRIKKGEPLAYILGYKDFYGLKFQVDKNVLIPRPETEELVSKVVQFIQTIAPKIKNKEIKILDVGTGSGIIAVSLAKILPNLIHNFKFVIYACDISKPALKIARKNAEAHRAGIRFFTSDILGQAKISPNVIVANLPYLDQSWGDKKTLKYEPKSALYAKEKGLFLIEKLLKQASLLHKKPQAIFLEFDPRQKSALNALAKTILPDFGRKFHKDLFSRFRLCELSYKGTVAKWHFRQKFTALA